MLSSSSSSAHTVVLVLVQRILYQPTSPHTHYTKPLQHVQAARAANAATLAKHMQKKALEKQADMQLLKAEARYKSTLSQIGGKSEVGQLSAKQLSQEIINEAKAAQVTGARARAHTHTHTHTHNDAKAAGVGPSEGE